MYIVDDELQIITDSLGNIYDYWNELFNSGETSNSFDFYFNRSVDFLNNEKIRYSINNSSDLVSSNSGDAILNISSGNIIDSSNNLVKFIDQDLSMINYYSYDYDENGYYGAIVGIYFDDINSISNIYRTSIIQNISIGDDQIYIKDTYIFSNLSFPLYIQVGSETILISSINIPGTYLNVDDEYNDDNGSIGTYLSGTEIFAFNKLEAKVIFGAPVSSSFLSSEDAADFNYYPPTPDNMIIVAKVLIKYPVTPSTYNRNSPGSGLDPTEIISIDSSMKFVGPESVDQPFTTNQIEAINSYYINMLNTKTTINYNKVLFDFCDTLKNIIFEDISEYDYSGSTFYDYWNHRPITRATYLQYGVQWDDFERFEFSEGFKKLWNDSEGEQLLTTFGIFSGNLMDSAFTSGVESPVISSIAYTKVSDSSLGAISPGTWSYAVTAITASGESPLSEFSSVSIPSNSSNNYVTINWNSISGATYYNVYRRISSASLVSDIRITDDNELLTNIFIDIGNNSSFLKTTRRGIVLTNKEIYSDVGSEFYAVVPKQKNLSSSIPILRLQDSVDSDGDQTNNGIRLFLTLEKPDQSTEDITIDIESGTSLGSSFIINNGTKYSKLLDMKVSILDGDLDLVGSRINWSFKDVVMIQNLS